MLIWYHGTTTDAHREIVRSGAFRSGSWFSGIEAVALGYAKPILLTLHIPNAFLVQTVAAIFPQMVMTDEAALIEAWRTPSVIVTADAIPVAWIAAVQTVRHPATPA